MKPAGIEKQDLSLEQDLSLYLTVLQIKCDKSDPCSSCRALHIPCHTLAVAPPASRKRNRDASCEQW